MASDQRLREIHELEELRGRLAKIKALFAGGPDTPCRTTWRDEYPGIPGMPKTEYVEVPMEDLRQALGE